MFWHTSEIVLDTWTIPEEKLGLNKFECVGNDDKKNILMKEI